MGVILCSVQSCQNIMRDYQFSDYNICKDCRRRFEEAYSHTDRPLSQAELKMLLDNFVDTDYTYHSQTHDNSEEIESLFNSCHHTYGWCRDED